MASSSSTSEMDQPHFILIPLMSQSHLIPFTDLATLIAKRGPTVTIVTTPLNAVRFKPAVDNAVNSFNNLKIKLLPLPFPTQEAGLPENCENMDALPSLHLFPHFLTATRMLLRAPLETHLRNLTPNPTCIVSDVVLSWTVQVAKELNIPRLVFHVISCFTLLCSHNIRLHNACERVASNSQTFRVPEIPDTIEFVTPQLPSMMRRRNRRQVVSHAATSLWEKFAEELKDAETAMDGVLVNTFHELEPNYIKGYKKVVVKKKKLWCVGPVSLCHGGNSVNTELHWCLKWLDLRPVGSVVYACFGSQSLIQASQLIEIALGLEASNRSFIWIIRTADTTTLSEIEKWMEEGKYEERVRERGLIIKEWVPQVSILSHKSVGGFVTHCGWNSTLEAVSCGVPMVTWPLWAEQFFNEKLVVQVLRVGVRVGVERMCMDEEECDDDEESNNNNNSPLVKKDEVKRAVEELMGEGEEALGRRERARMFEEAAKKAVEEGGSSDVDLAMLIHDIMVRSASTYDEKIKQDI